MRLIRAIVAVAAAAAFALVLELPAGAAQYEVFIEMDTEEDLNDLLANSEIGEDTFNTLLALYRSGVDLNRASREQLYSLPNLTYAEVDAIIAYRKEAGTISDPAVLVLNNVISKRKFLSISPFLVIRDPKRALYATDGRLQAGTLITTEDDRVPPWFIRTQVSTLKNLTLGFQGVIDRNRLSNVVYDPTRDALAANPQSTRLRIPKLYARWETDKLDVVAGHFRIGFGQRLTFDNTSELDPNGIYFDDVAITRPFGLTRRCKESQGELAVSPCSGAAGEVYVTPDFNLTQRLMGVAFGLKEIQVGKGKMQTYGFLSYQPKSIYQYELYRPDRCANPDDDDNEDCKAPNVFNSSSDPLGHASRFSFATLPNVYRETVVGGNVTYFADNRTHVGLTGYGAGVDFLTTGIELDFQEWSRLPYGGPFGAVGADVAWGKNWLDLFVELAHSFDGMDDGNGNGGGGPAAVVRATATKKKQELEASVRYYDRDFANPFARPISASDLSDGLRARDELGARVRYTGNVDKKVRVRTSMDIWRQNAVTIDGKKPTKIEFLGRINFDSSKTLRFGGWARYQNKGLGIGPYLRGGNAQHCFTTSVEEDERGEPIPCAGKKLQGAVFFRLAPKKSYWISGQLTAAALDESRGDDYNGRNRQDVSAWLKVITKPADGVRISARTRYLNQARRESDYLEESVWTYFDIQYRLAKKTFLRVRYDLYYFTDDRSSTSERSPNPEHWLFVEARTRF